MYFHNGGQPFDGASTCKVTLPPRIPAGKFWSIKTGKLDNAWDEANVKGWTVVSMKDDWKRVFPFE